MNRISHILGGVVVGVLLTFSSIGYADLVERIVAIVNGEIVLESDFKQLERKMLNATLIDESLLVDSSLEQMKKSRKIQLDYLINEKILESEIKRLNLTVTMERVDQEIQSMAKQNHISSEDLLRAVEREGVPASEYQAFLKTKIERQSLVATEIISKLRITDEEALVEFLRRNKSAKASINEFSLSHIFFNPKKGGNEAARKKAEHVLASLKAGQPFEDLAEQNSEDPNFSAGGLLGTFKSGEFLPEIESAIGQLEPGQVSEIIKSRMGLHIVKLLTKKVTLDPRFEREKEEIKARLMEGNFKRQMNIWLNSKLEDSQIRINAKP